MKAPSADVSVTWSPCARCPHRHPSHAPCPPSGVWLVLVLCGRGCSARTGAYCRWHGGHRPPEPVALVPDVEEQAEHRRRVGEDGGDLDN